jgi:hypothetical protein
MLPVRTGAMSTTTVTEPAAPRIRPSPRLLLGAEGIALTGAAVAAYWTRDASWLVFLALVLAPDLSMLGYLAGARVGAATYNLAHTLVAPTLLLGGGLLAATPLAVDLALVWVAHIGLDRAVGYGLKYPTGFDDNHLDRV